LRDEYKEFGVRMMHKHTQMLMKDGSKSNSLEGQHSDHHHRRA